MSDSTATRQEPAPSPAGGRPEGNGLARVVKILVTLLVAVIVVFGVVYYFGQRTEPAPSIAEQAVTTAEQQVRDNPNDVGARLSLAASYAQSGRGEEALGQYREILTFAPDNRVALLGAGRIQFEQADFAGARAQFEAIVKSAGTGEFATADPQLEEAYYYLGASKLNLGDTTGSIQDLQAALAIDRSDADAWYILGNALNKTSDFAGAADAFTRALAFIPTDWCEPYDGLSTAYGNLKQDDGIAFAGGMAAVCRGDYDEGITSLKSVEEGQFALSAKLGLGLASEKAGDPQEAMAYYKQVIESEPTNVAALSALARLGAGPAHTALPSTSAPETGDNNS